MLECPLMFLDHHRNWYCRLFMVILQKSKCVIRTKCPPPPLTCRYFLFSTNIFLLVIGGRCRVAGWQCLDVSVVTGLHKYNGIISGVFTTNWCILHTAAHYPPHSVSFLLCQVSRDHHQAFDAFDGSHHLHPRAPGWVSAAVLGAKINKMGKKQRPVPATLLVQTVLYRSYIPRIFSTI